MTMYPSSSTQQPAAICALKSPADAIHILEAVRLGLVPRVTRRLTGHERSMIRPGTVWVWEEEETNMRRWTDGRRWGASRVGGGGFLVYTESSDSLSPPPSRADSPSYQGYYANGREGGSGTPPRRPEPLVKQTYSTSMTHPVTRKVKKFHVVAYSSKRNPQGDGANPLPLPHQLPNLANIKITPGIWPDWETRRDEFGSRRGPTTPHSSHSIASHGHHHSHSHDGALPHPPPHHPAANGPPTPVTATAGGAGGVPYPPPESYRPASPQDYPPPPDRGHPMYADRRYPPYDYYGRPPPPHDMYPHDRYPPQDRYGYYPPPPGRDMPPYGGPPPHDYRYDPYYDPERERERGDKAPTEDGRGESRAGDARGRSPPRDPRAWPPPRGYYRDPYGPREADMYGRPPPPHEYDYRRLPPSRETGYPTPPPREGEYPRPREGDYPPPPLPREGDFPPGPPRDSDYPYAPPPPREGEYAYPPREGGDYPYLPPREGEYPPPPPREGEYMPGPPRDGDYSPRGPHGGDYPPRPPSQPRLGKRTTDTRPSDMPPEVNKRLPSWSPHPNGPPPPSHARHPSGSSSHGSNPRAGDDPRLNGARTPNGRSPPRMAGEQPGMMPSDMGRASPRGPENWGRVPA